MIKDLLQDMVRSEEVLKNIDNNDSLHYDNSFSVYLERNNSYIKEL
ncbi:5464_t:CDS:2, partial [Cetraspora pellucida]